MGKKIINNITWILITVYFFIYYCAPPTIFSLRMYFIIIIPIVILIYQLLQNKFIIRINLLLLLFLIIVVNAFITDYINSDPYIYTLIYLVSLLIIVLVLFNLCRNTRELNFLLKIIFWTSILGGVIIGFYQKISGNYLFINSTDMVIKNLFFTTATQSNANFAAMQLATTFYIGLYLKRVEKNKIIDFFVLLTFIAIILTMSRTTIVATVFGIFINLIINKKHNYISKNRFIRIIVIIFVILVSTPIFSYAINKYQNKNLDKFESISLIKTEENLSIRQIQWKSTIKVVGNSELYNFIFGFGRNYNEILGKVSGYSITTHNTILEVLIKYGVISFLIYIYICMATFKTYIYIYINNKKYNSIICGWITIFICLQMISWISIDSFIFILLPMLIKRNLKKESLNIKNI